MRARHRGARRGPCLALGLACAVSTLLSGDVEARRKAGGAEARILPHPELTQPPYVHDGEAVELLSHGVGLRVRALDEDQRETYFALRSHTGFDPLPRRADFPEGYTVFEASFENRSGRELAFAPALTMLRRNLEIELRPVHFDVLFDILRARHVGEPDAERRAIAGIEDFHVHRLVLRHGERATRLLVYEGYPDRTRALILELGPLAVGVESFSPVFNFRVDFPAPPRTSKPRSENDD